MQNKTKQSLMTNRLFIVTTAAKERGEGNWATAPHNTSVHTNGYMEGGREGLGIQFFYELLLLRVEWSILNMSRAYLRPYVKLRAVFKPCDFYVNSSI